MGERERERERVIDCCNTKVGSFSLELANILKII